MTTVAEGTTVRRRVLLVHATDPEGPPGGRAMLSRTNEALLRTLFGDGLHEYHLPGCAVTMGGAARGHIDGVNSDTIAALIGRVETAQIDTVFIDGSNLGAVAQAIKAATPAVRIATFFHNVEARFFWGSFRARRTPRAFAVLVANIIAERKAVRASDVRICLSRRDGDTLRRFYGRGADVVAPMVLQDARRMPADAGQNPRPHRFLLFVGGAFYANIDGVRWFARHVAPRTGLRTVIVGRGMDALAGELSGRPEIMLVGAVDDLTPWYRDAYVVVAPIFDGSGMKTKVAEALMHGKRVIGTPEAFSGYEPAVVEGGWQCADAEAFCKAVRDAVSMDLPSFDPDMRALYERLYSPEAAMRRLADALGADRAAVPENLRYSPR